MSAPDWINGDYEAAKQLVAERAVYARMVGPLVKKADVDWQSLLASPEVRGALIGAGTGGLGGALLSDNKLKGVLMGGLAGAGVGAGAGHFFRGQGPKASPADQRAQEEALDKSRNARMSLGILGADENAVNKAVEYSNIPSEAAKQIEKAVPGAAEQAGNIPAATVTALSQGRPGDAIKQLDVLGLKNITPFSGHFSPGTLATAMLANAGVRGGREAYRFATKGPTPGQIAGSAQFASALGKAPSRLPGSRTLSHWSRAALDRLTDKAVRQGYFHTDAAASRVDEALMRRVRRLSPTPDSASPWLPANDRSLLRDLLPRLTGRTGLEQGETGAAGPGRLSRLTGGSVPLLASLAPLLYREWLGSGYRSGHEPAMDLAKALEVLRQ